MIIKQRLKALERKRLLGAPVFFSKFHSCRHLLFGFEGRIDSMHVALPFRQLKCCSFSLLAGFGFYFQTLGIISKQQDVKHRFHVLSVDPIKDFANVDSEQFREVNRAFPSKGKTFQET